MMTAKAIRSGFRLCGFVLALLVSMALEAATPVTEYELKAALLYNFASYTIWPSSAPSGMTLCVLGSDPFGPSLDALTAKSQRGAAIVVRRVRQPREAMDCHVVYLGETTKSMETVLAEFHGKPVLTVAESEEAVKRGVMIGLRVEGSRLIFDVNNVAVQAAGLAMSSKLLRLARTVYSSP